jgi:hypothetical protein
MLTTSTALTTGSTVDSDGMSLTVYHVSYGPVSLAAVESGDALPVEADATQDGRYIDSRWHDGPETGEPVYFARFNTNGRYSHGWVDSVSRRITQTG